MRDREGAGGGVGGAHGAETVMMDEGEDENKS